MRNARLSFLNLLVQLIPFVLQMVLVVLTTQEPVLSFLVLMSNVKNSLRLMAHANHPRANMQDCALQDFVMKH